MTFPTNSNLLTRVNTPLYTVKCISDRHIVVAGGGGTSKTGIDNVISIYELINEDGICRAKLVTRYDTGSNAVMDSCIFYDGKSYLMAAGIANKCQLYKLKWKILSPDKEGDMLPSKSTDNSKDRRNSGVNTVRKRHRTDSSSYENENTNDESKSNSEARKPKKGTKKTELKDSNDNTMSEIGFEISELACVETDFFKDEPYQKVVKVSPDGSVIITAGADGNIRTWKYPSMQLLYTIKAHSTEVDDIDISPLGDKIVSVSSDAHSFIWFTKNGKKECELEWMPPKPDEKYLMKSCRFARSERFKEKPVLFTIAVPAIRKKPPSPCYLCKWNTSNFTPLKCVPTGTDIISSLATSDNGRFVAVGTLSGSIHLYISFSLQHLKSFENVHNIFITGLEFLSSSDHTKLITGGKEVSIVSISVDNHINVSHIAEPKTISLPLFVFILVACLIAAFLFCDMIGL